MDDLDNETRYKSIECRIKSIVILIGNSGVGKTCIISRFAKGLYLDYSGPTLGTNFISKLVPVHDSQVILQIWDTAGSERFRSFTKSFYRNSSGVLIVYDVTTKSSFDAISFWVEDLRNICPDVLVGNKIDHAVREVKREKAEEYCRKKGFSYFEVSAKTGENINHLFEKFVEDVDGDQITKIERRSSEIHLENTIQISDESTSCC